MNQKELRGLISDVDRIMKICDQMDNLSSQLSVLFEGLNEIRTKDDDLPILINNLTDYESTDEAPMQYYAKDLLDYLNIINETWTDEKFEADYVPSDFSCKDQLSLFTKEDEECR